MLGFFLFTTVPAIAFGNATVAIVLAGTLTGDSTMTMVGALTDC